MSQDSIHWQRHHPAVSQYTSLVGIICLVLTDSLSKWRHINPLMFYYANAQECHHWPVSQKKVKFKVPCACPAFIVHVCQVEMKHKLHTVYIQVGCVKDLTPTFGQTTQHRLFFQYKDRHGPLMSTRLSVTNVQTVFFLFCYKKAAELARRV